jgi:FkbM family methyltransferase
MTAEHLKSIRWHLDWEWLLRSCNYYPRTFFECGVGPLDISGAYQLRNFPTNLVLVEPNRELADAAAVVMPHATLHRVAIGDKPGRMQLTTNGGSSYLSGTWAPTPVTSGSQEVEVVTFETIDDGTIDAMQLDCEGQEWTVLSAMKSRPRFLSVEIWGEHPHREQIENWLTRNRYQVFFTTGPQGETWIMERR